MIDSSAWIQDIVSHPCMLVHSCAVAHRVLGHQAEQWYLHTFQLHVLTFMFQCQKIFQSYTCVMLHVLTFFLIPHVHAIGCESSHSTGPARSGISHCTSFISTSSSLSRSRIVLVPSCDFLQWHFYHSDFSGATINGRSSSSCCC